MTRGLDKEFIKDLKEGKLLHILQRIQSDHTIDLQIRDNYINLYYRGGQLLKISKKQSAYEVDYDADYYNKLELYPPTLTNITAHHEARNCVDNFQHLKLAMDLHFSANKKSEREFQQLLSRENSYSSISNSTDYFVVDVEFQENIEHISTKFDAIAIKWASTSSKRKSPNNSKLQLAFIELKFGDKALTGSAGLVDHLKKAYVCFNSCKTMNKIKATVLTQFAQKRELGLVHFSNNGNENQITKLDGKPEFIFVLTNHAPASTILTKTINSPEFKKAHDSISNLADVRFATSSFMGYGLYDKQILDLESFKEKLLK